MSKSSVKNVNSQSELSLFLKEYGKPLPVGLTPTKNTSNVAKKLASKGKGRLVGELENTDHRVVVLERDGQKGKKIFVVWTMYNEDYLRRLHERFPRMGKPIRFPRIGLTPKQLRGK